MTVAEFVEKNVDRTKFWLCPNALFSGKINTDPVLAGYECTRTTIPQKVQDKEVVKHFGEEGVMCIIWEHTPYKDGRYQSNIDQIEEI